MYTGSDFNENDAFRNMLMVYTHLADYRLTDKPKILDACCGKCLEASVLAEFFGGSVTGIDRDEKEIEAAKAIHAGKEHTFLVGDARSFPEQFRAHYDIVLIRHADSNSADFPKILRECHNANSDEGLLIATFYSTPDFVQGARSINSAGYRTLLAEQNRFAFMFNDSPMFASGIDRYVVFALRDDLSLAKRAKKALARLFCVG